MIRRNAYNQLSTYRTTIKTEDGVTQIVYVDTAIVKFDGQSVTLDNGGFQSVTTKKKMNQAANQFGLGFGVFQRKGVWFVSLPNGQTVEFQRGMTFKKKAA